MIIEAYAGVAHDDCDGAGAFFVRFEKNGAMQDVVAKNKFEKTSQKRIDLFSLYAAVEYAASNKCSRLIVYTDSDYLYFQYMKHRVQTGIAHGKSFVNKELWQDILGRLGDIRMIIKPAGIDKEDRLANSTLSALEHLNDDNGFVKDEDHERNH